MAGVSGTSRCGWGDETTRARDGDDGLRVMTGQCHCATELQTKKWPPVLDAVGRVLCLG